MHNEFKPGDEATTFANSKVTILKVRKVGKVTVCDCQHSDGAKESFWASELKYIWTREGAEKRLKAAADREIANLDAGR